MATRVPGDIVGKAMTDGGVVYGRCQNCKECDKELDYPFKDNFRGQGIIIVNKNFIERVKKGPQGNKRWSIREDESKVRKGADKDLEYLKGIYDRYDIDYTNFTYLNQKPEETDQKETSMKDLVQNFADNVEQKSPVIFVSIATHGGEKGTLVETDISKTTTVETLVKIFADNTNLMLIPKVFIIQACRGSDDEEAFEEPTIQFATKHSNFLIIHSTTEEYTSFRSEEQGSWLLEILHECVRMPKYRNLHFVEVVTVCTFWAINSHRQDPEDAEDSKGAKPGKELVRATETPTFHSTLTKFLRFPDKKK
ncbi:Casp3 protein [Oopsacas minuta]|uniref:Casp3 protein n=1 Tax=Oopsacas minuta TaxID=111878 RepID=A0AAV7JXT8_9METZ|nr:Casp3 protein [Oopsacas minuta]